MAYQPSWVIKCQSKHWRETEVVLLKLSLGDKGDHTLLKGSRSKVNVIVRPEFELAYFDIAVQHVSHNTSFSPFDKL